MATKVLGFIELIWTCDSCGTKNPGPIKSCTACGAPQPLNVQFEKVDTRSFDFIKDQALIRMAQIGADKHCPYCGTRNLADTATCVKCGSDITVGSQTREASRIIENPQPKIIPATRQPAKLQSTWQSFIRKSLVDISWEWSVTEPLITVSFAQENATGSGNRFSKVSAENCIESGRPNGGTTKSPWVFH